MLEVDRSSEVIVSAAQLLLEREVKEHRDALEATALMLAGCFADAVSLSGGTGRQMQKICDALIIVPSTVTARIHEMHILIGHMLCKGLEERLGLV